MAQILETRACRACSAAKRRCGKQTPHCLRCRTRGIRCTYPPPKPSSFVLCKEDTVSLVSNSFSNEVMGQHLSEYFPEPLSRADEVDLSSFGPGLDGSELFNPLLDNQFFSSWFAYPDSWEVQHPSPEQLALFQPDLKRFIATIRRWLVEWVEKGSNSFIHTALYQSRLPRSIQDAYTTLSCYFHKTSQNEQIIFRIMEDRVRNLTAGYSNTLSNTSDDISPPTPLDPLEHIARTQALLVYQFIGLYEGDIRLRYLMETNMSLLNSWMETMIYHVSQSPHLGSYLTAVTPHPTPGRVDICPEPFLWHSWILSESARRTWVVNSGIQAVFQAVQQTDSNLPCQGGMMFTTRRGIWEAQSSLEWETLCSETDVGFMQSADTGQLFTAAAPGEVNDFTKACLEVSYGREKVERWATQMVLY